MTRNRGHRLNKVLRVDVDRNLHSAARLGRGGQHGAQEALSITFIAKQQSWI
jgi:hypothetical protein